jgi:toxin ParE1/3/4
MSTNTMRFALPGAKRSEVDQRVSSGRYGNTSEYLRELIRRDQDKKCLLRPQAEVNLMDATRHYEREGGIELAEHMVDAAIAALEPIERMLEMGSPRLGLLCEIPGLRSWRVAGFPMQWLCFEAEDHLDVVRLIGDRQDVVAILGVDE